MRHFVLGNGPSLSRVPFESLMFERTWGVNRIWKLFPRTAWRPTYYVRSEVPSYRKEDVLEDLEHIKSEKLIAFLQAGFKGFVEQTYNWGDKLTKRFFGTCPGEDHPWHLPEICGFGTVVHTAIQLAIYSGATEIYLLGCDLGKEHFYDEPFENEDLALKAHQYAYESSPVPIYDCSDGDLDVYPKVDMNEVLRKDIAWPKKL